MAKNSVTYTDPKTHFIYALIDPRDEAVYYVGQTIDLEQRNYMHVSPSHCKMQPVGDRTGDIRKAGLKPIMHILDQVDTFHLEIALRIEECWRIEMTNQGETLLNVWKTGRCIDTQNPMKEATYIKQFALVTVDQLIELKETDKQRALALVFEAK